MVVFFKFYFMYTGYFSNHYSKIKTNNLIYQTFSNYQLNFKTTVFKLWYNSNKGNYLKNNLFYLFFIICSTIIAQCDEAYVEDDCGECWQPYCYCISDHIPNFDVTQDYCENGQQCWWIGPGGAYEPGDYEFCLFDPYWNSQCMGCMDPLATNYNSNASVNCNDNCDNELGDCCEYNLNTFDNSNDKTISLVKAYPNPFNPSINIIIDSPEVDFVELKVHDTKGQLIDVIFNGHLNVGTHNFIWNANSYSSGIYILNISSSTINQSQLIHYVK